MELINLHPEVILVPPDGTYEGRWCGNYVKFTTPIGNFIAESLDSLWWSLSVVVTVKDGKATFEKKEL